MKRYIKSSSGATYRLYTIKSEYGYPLLTLDYNRGDSYEICAEDGFKSAELDQMSDDGYTVEFGILNQDIVVDTWNKELDARGLSGQITLDELKRKVRGLY